MLAADAFEADSAWYDSAGTINISVRSLLASSYAQPAAIADGAGDPTETTAFATSFTATADTESNSEGNPEDNNVEPLVDHFQVQYVLEAQDLSGNPISSVVVGEDFKLAVFVQDLRDPPPEFGSGVFAAYVNIAYNSTLASIDSSQSIEYGDFFNSVRKGDLSTPGQISSAGAATTNSTPPGNATQFLFSVVVHADLGGTLTFTSSFDSALGNDTLLFLSDVATPEDDITFGSLQLQILDTPQLSIGNVTVTEGTNGSVQTPMVFTASLSSPAEETVTVEYTTNSGTATTPADFVATSGTLTFAPGETQQFITVLIEADAIDEDDETFTVTLSNPTGAELGTASTATGTIIDDDAAPTASIGSVSPIAEGDVGTTDLVFTVSLSGNATSKTVTVQYTTVDGSALAGSDYIATNGTLTFAPGTTSQLITVAILGDEIDEDDETFSVNLAAPVNATLGTSSVNATILDDDDPPSVSIGDATTLEGDSGTTPLIFTATLSAPSSKQITVAYNTSDGSAQTGDNDYTVASGTLTFAPGVTTQLVTVLVQGDTLDEADEETFSVILTAPVNAGLGDAIGTGTIVDDDAPPVASVSSVSQLEGHEGTTEFVFTVGLSTASGQTVTVEYATSDDSTTAGVDYAATSGTLTFEPGAITQTVTVLVHGDTDREENETFVLELSNPSNVTLSTVPGQGIGTIINDDGPHLSFEVANVSQEEGNGGTTAFVFAVNIGETDLEQVTVVYSTVDGTATVADNDYVPTSGTLTFAPGESVQFITVLVNGDHNVEGDETFSVVLSSPTNATLVSDTATGTILNDDELLIGISDGSVVEGDSGTTDMVFTVILSSESQQTVTVEFDTQPGTALAGADYVATSGTLTFALEITTAFITVAVIGDLADEDDETFSVRLFNSTNASNALSEATAVIATGTIVDDDPAPAIALSPVTASITEGNAGTTNQIFTVTLSQASGKTVMVQFATADVTALAGSDYTAASGTLTFAPGETSQLITVAVIGDTIDEDDETFTVNLSTPDNATLSAASSATVTIIDDDAAPTLSISDVSQQEGNSGTTDFVFTVSLSGATSRTATVNFATAAGTATAGSDFISTSGTLTFVPGVTQQLITVGVLGDTTNEANETFFVNLTSPSNATLADSQGIGTIQNDDALPTLSINDVTQVEGDSGTTEFVFTVALSAASGQQVTVAFATADGTATAPDDYAATSGTLTFAPGTTTQTITVHVVGDLIQEPDETFFINLSSATNATLADAQGTGTIENGSDSVVDTESTISGFAFIDGNKDNLHTTGEKPLAGVTVFLVSDGGTLVTRQTSTAADGSYSFANLDPGTYNIFFAQPINYKTGEVAVGSHGGTLLSGTPGFAITIASPGGVTATENNFFVDGLHADYISQRLFLASTSDTPPAVLYLSLGITSATDVINAANATNASINGTGEPGASISVFVTDGATDTAVMTTSVAADGTWSITDIDVSGLSDGTLAYQVAATNAQGHTSNALRSATKDTVAPTVDITTVTNPVNIGNVSNVTASGTGEVGANLSIVASDGTNSTAAQTTTIAAGGAWSVSGFNLSALNDGTITFTVTATDAAGNTATDSLTTSKDTVAPTVAITSVTDPANSANAANTTISGTGTVGATISVVVGDGTNSTAAQTTTVGSGGTWSISGINVTSLNDGTITYTATASDAAGNTSTATRTAQKDTTAPAVAVTVTTNPVNAGNVTSTSANGTGEVGANISLVVTDGTNSTAALTTTVTANGTWSITGINVSSLSDGTITFTATATDTAGNTATATSTAQKDVVAPALELIEVTDPINASEATNVAASGTGEVGASISLVVSDGTNSTAAMTTTVASDGTWSVSGIDVSGLDDGTITFTATATDAAGNTATDTLAAELDTTAPAVEITSVSNPVNNDNVTTAAASGTGEVGASISLVVSDGTNSTADLTTTVAGDGTWSIIDIDLSGLDDGTIIYTVTATDAVGNTATDSQTATKDTLEDPFTLVTDPIGILEADAVTAGGTGEPGAAITVVATDGTNDTIEYTTTVGGDGIWSIIDIDVTGLNDGVITFNVTMTDAGGNTTTDSVEADKDTVAPAVEILLATNPVNAANVAIASASGTGEVGAGISLVVTDGANDSAEYVTTVAGDGTWSIIDIDLSGLADGTITYNVTASDAAGNTATDSVEADKDTVAPTVELSLATDPVNNSSVSTASASGTGEVGADISLVVTDGTNDSAEYTTTVAGDGTWSIIDIDLTGLLDGTITYMVTATDAAGNTATDDQTALKDTLQDPSILVTDPIGILEADAVVAGGTGEPGADITVVATDGSNSTGDFTTTVAGDGTWSISDIDVTGLVDGPITFEVTMSDAGGNTTSDSVVAQKDTVAPDVDFLSVTDPIDATNETQVEASGTGEVGASIVLVVTDGTNTTTEYSTTVAGDGTWSIADVDVTGLDYGTLTFNVTASDAAGNETTDSRTAEYEDIVPPALDVLTGTDPVNAANVTAAAVSGTGEAGADISLIATDGANDTIEYTTTVALDGTWSITDIDLSALDDGTITYMVTASDAAGNTSTENLPAEKDVVAPVVDITAVTDPVNSGNATSVSATGTGEVGAEISLVVSDGTNSTAALLTTVALDGTWSIIDIDVSALDDGTITYMVTATDAAGNVSAVETLDGEKDTVAPEVEISAATDPIDPGNETDASASGTGEVGATIVLFVTDGSNNTINYDTIVAGDGTWAITGIDVSGLDDGTITYTVAATDAAGNSTTVTQDADKDSIADILAAEDDFGDPVETEFTSPDDGFADSVDSALEDELSWLA